MSKAQTRTATTAHGTVEYETVTCDSCGNEVAKDDAQRFVVGKTRTDRNRHNYRRFEFSDGDYSAGWACPYCTDEGPIDFPGSSKSSRLPSFLKGPKVVRMIWTSFWEAHRGFVQEIIDQYEREQYGDVIMLALMYATGAMVVGMIVLLLAAPFV